MNCIKYSGGDTTGRAGYKGSEAASLCPIQDSSCEDDPSSKEPKWWGFHYSLEMILIFSQILHQLITGLWLSFTISLGASRTR